MAEVLTIQRRLGAIANMWRRMRRLFLFARVAPMPLGGQCHFIQLRQVKGSAQKSVPMTERTASFKFRIWMSMPGVALNASIG